jgi:hypothetical protein
MIISASRRTDIPAFYSRWLINRIRSGFCVVPNPFNHYQITEISLSPEDVDMFVFWTRNPRPLFQYLHEMDERGYHYYFQFTLMDNPALIDRHNPPVTRSVNTFCELADRIGPERVVWRYDPMLLSTLTPYSHHLEIYAHLAQTLKGSTIRSVISFLDLYPKIRRRIDALETQGAKLLPAVKADPNADLEIIEKIGSFAHQLSAIASSNGMEIVSCAEKWDLRSFGIRAGKCIDDELIQRVFDLDVTHTKDPGQREACGCVVSKDIGMYDSCLFGCCYCYATGSFERARRNYLSHDPDSASLY